MRTNTSFFIGSGTGWSWVPDTTTNASTLLSCSRLQTTCKVIVRERGHVEGQNVVAEGISLNARSPIVELGSARVRIRSATGVLATRPKDAGGTTTLDLEISVEGTDGNPLPNRTVDLTLDGVEGTGGHSHTGTMPPGSLSSASVNTGASGVSTVTYSADVFGGSVQITGTSTGAASALETITVRVPGLVQLFEAGSVDTIGPTTTHPSNHWGTPGMVSALVAMADTFHTEYTRNLPINDISLQLGGKFDVSPAPINYNRDGDHKEHRIGLNADVRTTGGGADSLTARQREFVRKWWENRRGGVYEHTGDNPHFHLTL